MGSLAVGDWELEARAGGPEQIDRIEAEWTELCSRAAEPMLVHHPAWIRADVTTRIGRDHRLVLVTARRAGQLEAVLPLLHRFSSFSGMPVRWLRGVTDTSAWSFDILCAAGGTGQDARDAMARFLAVLRGWDVLLLPEVPRGAEAEDLLARAEALGHRVGRVELMHSPYLPLDGWDGTQEWWLRGVSGNFRSSIRRALKKVPGELHLTRFDQPDTEALRRFVELEAAGWKGQQGSAIASSPEGLRRFHALVDAAVAAGSFAFHQIEADGKLLAAQFGVVCGGRYSMLKIAHDEGLRQLAPGHLLTYLAIQDCAEQGLREYDFIGQDEEWKCKWTPHRRVHAHHFVFRRGAYGRAVHFAKFRLRPELKRILRREPAPA